MDTGNTAWILVCSALVLLMTPGLAFFYGGLVREKQVINTIKMSFIALGIISLEWAIVGYSLAFSEGNSLIGGLAWVGLRDVAATAGGSEISPLAFMIFQMMFAIITPALISGAVVGRMKFKAYALFIAAWGLLIYCPLAHWVWGPGGWIAELGALDFAGGTVVHVSAGVSALVAALVLGPRPKSPKPSASENTPHNVPFVVLGASLLWFGWFGFNAGSALSANGIAVLAFTTTMLAAAAAVVTWVVIEMICKNTPTATSAAVAAVVGLVAVTPAAGFVTPMAAIAIGAIGALASCAAMVVIKRTRLDDTLDVFACHGVGGIVGSVLTGVFATTAVNAGGADGLLYGNAGLLYAQFVGVLAAAVFAGGGTLAIMLVVRAVTGLRTSDQAVRVGIDVVEHDERAYRRDTGRTWLVDEPQFVTAEQPVYRS